MSQQLIPDIPCAPIKDRSSLSFVELRLSDEQTVRAVGVVYGLEHEVSGPGFRAKLFLDQYNQRVKILDYEATDYHAMIMSIRWLAEANGFDKIIAMAYSHDWQNFLKAGYLLEAVIKHYHKGKDAFVVSKFRTQSRLTSTILMDEILLVEDLMNKSIPESRRPLDNEYLIRLATVDDIPSLVELYKKIFKTYPSPLIHESFLRTIFGEDSIFAVCVHDGCVVSAASAELHEENLAAELTDCVTMDNARGKGIMSHILLYLEGVLVEKGYLCSYTMARSRSYGMNCVFYMLGYDFMGRMINNCDIYGDYEDINIWVKSLAR